MDNLVRDFKKNDVETGSLIEIILKAGTVIHEYTARTEFDLDLTGETNIPGRTICGYVSAFGNAAVILTSSWNREKKEIENVNKQLIYEHAIDSYKKMS